MIERNNSVIDRLGAAVSQAEEARCRLDHERVGEICQEWLRGETGFEYRRNLESHGGGLDDQFRRLPVEEQEVLAPVRRALAGLQRIEHVDGRAQLREKEFSSPQARMAGSLVVRARRVFADIGFETLGQETVHGDPIHWQLEALQDEIGTLNTSAGTILIEWLLWPGGL